jgi:hypothetical protein
MDIVYTKGFIADLDALAYILYEKEYYSHYESVERYIIFLYDTIEKHLLSKRKRKNAEKYLRYGEYYVTVNPNRKTTWYIFLDQRGDIYRINAIFNNHVRIAGLLE